MSSEESLQDEALEATAAYSISSEEHSSASSEASAVASAAERGQDLIAAAPVGGSEVPFVYAIGRISPRFPSLSVEKEFAQATGRSDSTDLTDRQAAAQVLRENRYIARQICWVFSIEGLETYLLTPRDSSDLDALVESVRPTPHATDIDVVIGVRGFVAPPEVCNGLSVPIVTVDQLYSFDVDSFMKSIPRPDAIAKKNFEPAAEEVFSRIMYMADNTGSTDEQRAINYLAVRYPAVYSRSAEMYAADSSLSAVDVRTSRLSGARKIVDVVFTYTHRQTDVDSKYFTRVDTTEEFPFLVTKLTPYYEA